MFVQHNWWILYLNISTTWVLVSISWKLPFSNYPYLTHGKTCLTNLFNCNLAPFNHLVCWLGDFLNYKSGNIHLAKIPSISFLAYDAWCDLAFSAFPVLCKNLLFSMNTFLAITNYCVINMPYFLSTPGLCTVQEMYISILLSASVLYSETLLLGHEILSSGKGAQSHTHFQ